MDVSHRTPANRRTITANEPRSFARFTLEKRLPAIISSLTEQDFPGKGYAAALGSLADEVRSLERFAGFGSLPDEPLHYWRQQLAAHDDETWITAPFLWVEFYFYWRLLECCEFFENGRDPFWAQTCSTTIPIEALHTLDRRAAALAANEASLEDAINWSLLGNCDDKSQLPNSAASGSGAEFMVDERSNIADRLRSARAVVILADNAGEELANDLLLAAAILAASPAATVELQVKPVPMFVSDATLAHVRDLADSTGEDKALHSFVSDLIHSPRLTVSAPWAGGYPEAHGPAGDAYVLAKGDLWYRRIFGDYYPQAAPALEGPGPGVLRIVKSEAANPAHTGGRDFSDFQAKRYLMAIV